MPRFFFEIVQDGDIQEDKVGVDLSAEADVQSFAVRRAASALLDAAELAPLGWWSMEVRNESRDTVGRISFVASGF